MATKPSTTMNNDAPRRQAGSVTSWLRRYRNSMRNGQSVDVPCGDCTACCRSNEYIVLQPDEVEFFDNVVINEAGEPGIKTLPDGYCPHLSDEGCGIYENRPRNCRNFDCRTMLYCRTLPTDRPLIAEALEQWDRSYKTTEDHVVGLALRMAARDLYNQGHAVDIAAGLACIGHYESYLADAEQAYRQQRSSRSGGNPTKAESTGKG